MKHKQLSYKLNLNPPTAATCCDRIHWQADLVRPEALNVVAVAAATEDDECSKPEER